MTTPSPVTKVETVPLDKVLPSTDNPRIIPDRAVEVVAKSIERFGWQQPIVIDREYVIIAGHTRLKAARHLGLKVVPVVVADNLTDEEAKAFRIADNRTGDYTSWDFPELVNQLDGLSDGFSDVLAMEDWKSLIEEIESQLDGLGDDNEADEDELADALAERGHEITVVCLDETSAAEVELELAQWDGVIDVRHKR